MDIQLLLSGLEQAPSFSDPVKALYDAAESIQSISSAADIDALLGLNADISEQISQMLMPHVELHVMEIHAKVIKPFVSQSDDEDDFI